MAIRPSSPQSKPPTQLSFPAPVFAKLSPRAFLAAHLSPPPPHEPLRPNGRKPHESRPPTAHTGSLSQASGSAVVRVGDTAVVCGVRAEILLAKDVPDYRPSKPATKTGGRESNERDNGDWDAVGNAEVANLGLLVPNLELATGCSPQHLPGMPPSVLAQSLSQRLLTLLATTGLVGAEQLRIRHQSMDTTGEEETQDEIMGWWTLYIDLLFISLDGNPFDAAWAAVLAALSDTMLPRARWDPDREMVVCDPRFSEGRKMVLNGFPIASTAVVFEEGTGKEGRAWLLADADDFEEGVCAEEVTVVVDGEVLLRVEKSGGGFVGMEEVGTCVELAGERWREWKALLGKA